MKIEIQKPGRSNDQTDLTALFITSALLKSPATVAGSTIRALKEALGSNYAIALKRLNFTASHGQSVVVPSIDSKKNSPLLIIGLELSSSDSTRERLERIRHLAAIVIKQANHLHCATLRIILEHVWIGGEEPLEAFWEGLALSNYTFNRYKTGSKKARQGIKQISLITTRTFSRGFAERMQAICESVLFARDLINMPANYLRPTDLAKVCQKSAREQRLTLELFDQKKLERIGAGGILCVGMGSDDQSYLARLTYKPAKGKIKKHIALVGKAVTFDSGGLVIKSSMETMKCDMSGGAAVLATMRALKALQLPLQVSAYIPITENMINGNAMRPGDIFTLLCGKTVEVLNTDAEGRLILADALTLASRAKPDAIIDLATLTGACAAALGSKYGGLFCNNRQLAETLIDASDLSGEPLWELPLAREYHKLIFSEVADYKNLFKDARAVTAALFLEEFVNKIPWAHLDIAGPAFSSSNEGPIRSGGVGFGVRTLIRTLEHFAAKDD